MSIFRFQLVAFLSRMIITEENGYVSTNSCGERNLQPLAKMFFVLATQSQFLEKSFLKKALFREIAIAMNTNTAFTGSHTDNTFWYQQFDLR